MHNHPLYNRVRKTIRDLPTYSSARSVASGGNGYTYLDANELPYEPLPGKIHYTRYPDQQPDVLQQFLSQLYKVDSKQLLVTRGADDAIDLCIRTFCTPGVDNIIICTPTFPMYQHHGRVQEAFVREVQLRDDFSLDAEKVIHAIDDNTKIVFLCSPNNPTGNLLDRDSIMRIVRHLPNKALVVVDEAYIDFSGEEGFCSDIKDHPNLAVLRTLSKSHGLAGLRIGAIAAQAEVIDMLRKVLPIYPISVANLDIVKDIDDKAVLENLATMRKKVMADRDGFIDIIRTSPNIISVFPSHTNFVLLKVPDAKKLYGTLRKRGYIGRLYSGHPALENCIRISVGNSKTMEQLGCILIKG